MNNYTFNEDYESDNSVSVIISSSSDEENEDSSDEENKDNFDEENENSFDEESESSEEENIEKRQTFDQYLFYGCENKDFNFFDKNNDMLVEVMELEKKVKELIIYNSYRNKNDEIIIKNTDLYSYQSEEDLIDEKEELLYAIYRFESNGIFIPRSFKMDCNTNIIDLRLEVENLKKEETKIKFKNNLLNGIYSFDKLFILLHFIEPFTIYMDNEYNKTIDDESFMEKFKNEWKKHKKYYKEMNAIKTNMFIDIEKHKIKRDMLKITNLIIELKTKKKITWK